MSADADRQIAIACPTCHGQVQKTFDWLRDNERLDCPNCGHGLAAERTAVVRYIEAIRRTMAEVAAR